MSIDIHSLAPIQNQKSHNGFSEQYANELEIFRTRWIESVDRKFTQEIENYSEFEPGLDMLEESLKSCDDSQEIAKIKIEFDQLLKKEREFRRQEIFQYFASAPSKNYCNNSDQYLLIRNRRLATSINDIERLFMADSEDESSNFLTSDLFSISSTSAQINNLVNPMRIHHHMGIHGNCARNRHIHDHHLNFLLKLKRFFSCF